MVGILGTALLQSSSTTTSIIVGLVAGGLPLDAAVPMIMGANIGTTITNTIVSLGQINHKKSFARALEAATVHDFFNFLAVLIFLPLELTTHLLSRLAQMAAGLFTGSTLSQPTALGLFKDGVKAPSDLLKSELLGLGLGGILGRAVSDAGRGRADRRRHYQPQSTPETSDVRAGPRAHAYSGR